MMKLLYSFLLCLALFSANAQEQDVRLRNGIGATYSINKKSDISIQYRLDLMENISQFRRSNISLSYNRKLNKWLSTEVYYRFMTNYDQDKHRFRIALSTDKKIAKKTKGDLRTMLQHDIEYFDASYLKEYTPEYFWRNRIKVEREINKKVSAQIFSEPFFLIDHEGLNLNRWRNGVGISYTKKRIKLSAEYFHQYEFSNKPNIWHVFAWGAEYDITRVIRPKKKKKK